MSKALDDIKRTLLEKHQLDEIANPDRTKKIDDRLAQGIRDVPVRKFVEQVQFLETSLLPRLEKKGGKTSPDYIFFAAVVKSLMWAIVLCDRYDFLNGKYIDQKIDLTLLRDRILVYESELTKYQALEDIFLTDSLDRYAQGVKNRVGDALKRTKPL